MSMYSMLFGRNAIAPVLLAMLDIDQGGAWVSGRFRDAFLSPDGTEIHLYTRNGGGNREHWDDEAEEGEGCRCTGCVAAYHLPKHPNYISDEDDDFDNTYATFVFSVPEEYREITAAFATGEMEPSVGEKFQKFIENMEAHRREL